MQKYILKRQLKFSILSTFLLVTINNVVAQKDSQQESDFPELTGPYFGQKAPVEEAEIFLEGIISTLNDPEMCAGFTNDGKEFYYNAQHNGSWAIFVTKEVEGKWLKPAPLWFTSNYTDRDFTMSPDGNRIYFGSNRPRKKRGKGLESLDIFFTERLLSGKWSEPKNIGLPVNTDYGENYPSVARNNNLYFFSCRNDGMGACEIYMSRFENGQYLPPENPGSAINSDRNDWDSFIAADESYIIFSSQNRDDSIGGQDLYVSYRNKNGSWTQAKNMGPRVNSSSGEICPSVSLDGKYFFFTSRRRGKADIFWLTTDIIDDLKPEE